MKIKIHHDKTVSFLKKNHQCKGEKQMDVCSNNNVKTDVMDCAENNVTEKTTDDAALSITEITIEEVSIDGICGVY
ncbi:mycofactocin precursor MftA [Desulfocicer niacini]